MPVRIRSVVVRVHVGGITLSVVTFTKLAV